MAEMTIRGEQPLQNLYNDCEKFIKKIDKVRISRIEHSKKEFMVHILKNKKPSKNNNFEEFLNHSYSPAAEFIKMHGKKAFSRKYDALHSLKNSIQLALLYQFEIKLTEDERAALIIFSNQEIFDKIETKYYTELEGLLKDAREPLIPF